MKRFAKVETCKQVKTSSGIPDVHERKISYSQLSSKLPSIGHIRYGLKNYCDSSDKIVDRLGYLQSWTKYFEQIQF